MKKETPCRKGMGPQMVLKNEKDEKWYMSSEKGVETKFGKEMQTYSKIAQTLRGYSQTYFKIAQTVKQASQTY